MTSPTDRQYIKEHDWVKTESAGTVIFGITDYAQESLGDIVFVDLPEIETNVTQLQSFGEVESVKAVSELIAPLSGKIIERNESVIETPELVNDSPYDDGWLLKVELTDKSELTNLMSAQEYDTYLAEGAG